MTRVMLAHTAHSAAGPVAAASPDLVLAVLALLDQPRRATEHDLLEAVSMPLDDHGDRLLADRVDATRAYRALREVAG